MCELIFFQPFFKQVLWGGHKLRDLYGYPIPGDDTGEAWGVSAHPWGASVVRGGTYDGQSLESLWNHHRELFGHMEGREFPLLVKMIDANDHLSIQVHPDDEYAFCHENGSRGKSEFWYILDCGEDADIVIGHHARSRRELKEMIDAGRWDELLKTSPIHKGDFFYIPAGTLHAIRKGTLLLEIQQNSDITYRLYDYGRLQDGRPRPLHLKEGMDVISCPYVYRDTQGAAEDHGAYVVHTLASGPYFTVARWNIKTHASIRQNEPFMILNVTEGCGTLDQYSVMAGDHILIPAGYGTLHCQGAMELIATHV